MSVWHFSPLHGIKAAEVETEQNTSKLPCQLCNAWGMSQVTLPAGVHVTATSPTPLAGIDAIPLKATKDYRGWIHPSKGFFPPDMPQRSLFSLCRAIACSKNKYKLSGYQWVNSNGRRKNNQGKRNSSKVSLLQHVITLQAALLQNADIPLLLTISMGLMSAQTLPWDLGP